jgi:hypothetical protein
MRIIKLIKFRVLGESAYAHGRAFPRRKCDRKVGLNSHLAGILWIGYGVVIHSFPIIISNVTVATLARLSVFALGVRMREVMNRPRRRELKLVQ